MGEIPTVLTADELLDKAFKKAAKVQVSDKGKVFRDRKTAVAKLDSVADNIQGTLNKYVKAFPDLETLHPFYKEILGLSFEMGRLKRSLAALGWAGAQVRRIAASQARTLRTTKNSDFVLQKMEEAYGRISSIVKQVGRDLEFVDKARNALQALPTFDPQAPVIVIAGFPNSGKSQLVRAMSTGKPEVAHYPFTTKNISLGHFKLKYLTYIVIDTPGLLDRPLEKRNDIERRAILALKYLADVIVFIVDPTCLGGDMPSQLHLLKEIEKDFGENATIIPVYGKCDATKEGDEDWFRVSGKTGDGIKELVDTASTQARKVKTDKIMELGVFEGDEGEDEEDEEEDDDEDDEDEDDDDEDDDEEDSEDEDEDEDEEDDEDDDKDLEVEEDDEEGGKEDSKKDEDDDGVDEDEDVEQEKAE